MNDFLDILHKQTPPAGQGTNKWTVAKMAEKIGACRCRVNDALNNRPGTGGHLRRKLAKLIIQEFPATCKDMLAVLKWDENGCRLTTGERANQQNELKFVKSVDGGSTTILKADVASIGITIDKEKVCIQIHT